MPKVAKFQLEDGRVARFEVPDDATPESAQALIQAEIDKNPAMIAPPAAPAPAPANDPAASAPAPAPSFVGDVVTAARQRNAAANAIPQKQYPSGPITGPEVALQQAGEAAGFAGDIAGAGISAAGRTLAPVGKAIVSAIPESLKMAASQGAADVSDSQIVEWGKAALKSGGEAWEWFKDTYPRAADNLSAGVNVGIMAAPVPKGMTAVKSEGALGKAGRAVTAAADKQVAEKKQAFLKDLVTPKQTKAVREDQVARTTEQGLLKKKVVEPTSLEKEVLQTLESVPTVSPKKTLVGNSNAIRTEIGREADLLEKALEKNPVVFPRKQIKSAINQAAARIQKDNLLTGDAQAMAEKIAKKAEQIIDSNPSTGAGLLKSRKELDKWIRSIEKDTVYDPVRENAKSIALREIRTTMNDFLDSKAVNVDVKASLKRQSNMYRALDNIDPKAAEEANNALSRALQRTADKFKIKSDVAKVAALTAGTGGAALVTSAAPALVAVGGTLYLGGKAVSSATTKRLVGKMLKATDKAIQVATDKEVLKQLRADRALLVDFLETEPQEETEPEKPATNNSGIPAQGNPFTGGQ